jgi:glycosyltransferase involved in cell wall biosynthesis
MKILVVVPYFASVYGGNTRVVKELYQCLGALDTQIDVITTDADGAYKLNVPLGEWVPKNNYRVMYFSCFHRYDFVLSSSLLRWLKINLNAYDIVHTHNRFSPLVAQCERICRQQRVSYVAMPHGMLEPWSMAYNAWKKKLYFPLIDKPSLKQAAALHVLTCSEAINISNLGIKAPAHVIANGVHRRDFESMPSPEVFLDKFPQLRGKTLILFLAQIHQRKGLDLLAPAFATAHARFPNSHLVIAGPESPGFLDTAKGFFQEEGCSSSVTFTGMLTGELKFSALAAATIYVAPYYSEGFSMSILEGMAAGLPALITTGCNFPEAGDAGVAKVVRVEAEAIAVELLELLRDSEHAKFLGVQARQFIFENYTWDVAAKKLKQLFLEVTAQSLKPRKDLYEV